jgi:tRNA (guanine37-N1)-methyltransferase
MFPGPLGHSLAGKALASGLWSLDVRDIREHGIDKHRHVDDTPAGGGPGMVMRADVLAASIDAASPPGDARPRLLMSPRGRPLTQGMVREFAGEDGLVIVCGRFEGVDERVIEARGLVEVSLGDFVLSGGEPAAIALLDAVVRLLPGVMGKEESGATKASSTGCWSIRTIPARATSKAAGSPRSWCRATTPRSPAGGMSRRSSSPGPPTGPRGSEQAGRVNRPRGPGSPSLALGRPG